MGLHLLFFYIGQLREMNNFDAGNPMEKFAKVKIFAIPSPKTNMDFMIHIEDEDGEKKVALSHSEFSKAIKGEIAEGVVIESGTQKAKT